MIDKRGTIRSVPNRSFSKKSLETLDKRINELQDSKADLINGKVPAEQLPSYVDDVVNGYLHDGKFYKEDTYQTEITPEEDKIYVDLATNISYRWTGAIYTPIGIPIEANPTLTGTESDLEGLQICDSKYKVFNAIRKNLSTNFSTGEITTVLTQDEINKLIDNPNIYYFSLGENFINLENIPNVRCYFTERAGVNYIYVSGMMYVNKGNDYGFTKLTVDKTTGIISHEFVILGKSFKRVTANSWVADSTVEGFSYKCEIECKGITSDSVVYVQFGDTEVASGNYSSTVETDYNKVTIWSKVNTSITIPLIKEI